MSVNKQCIKCNEIKLIEDFHNNNRTHDKKHYYCKVCNKNLSNIWHKNNLNQSRNNAKAWNIKNPNKVKKIAANWYENNKDKKKAQVKIWSIKNKEKVNSLSSKKRAIKLNRTPKWLTKIHFNEINLFYKLAKIKTEKTGVKHHVDHIIPLQGKNISGLHVPWNLQILTETENIKKSNKYE